MVKKFLYLLNFNKVVITWQVESFWSGSHEQKVPKRKSRDNNHPELHPGQFNLLHNASPSRASTWSRGTFFPTHLSPTHLSPYALVSLHTRLPTHLSYCYVRVPAGRTFRLSIYLRLSTYQGHSRLLQYATGKLSCRLDVIDPPLLYGSQLRHQLTRVTDWMTSGHLQYVISPIMKDHLQYAIKYLGKLVPWQRSDGYPPSVCHQVSQ